MGFLFLTLTLLNNLIFTSTSVYNERVGVTSVSKNCNNKPCFQGTCDSAKCRCFSGWGGEQCDHCHGRIILNDDSETIADGPQNYTASSRCMWIIKDRNDSSLLLFKFNQFETECSWDHVYFYDGYGVHGQEIGAFSGSQPGREFVGKSGRALVFFFSDIAFQTSGFDISFRHGECLKNCSSHGNCLLGVCHCSEGYTGKYCETRICTVIGIRDEACSGNGTCQANNKCKCEKMYHGDRCQKKDSLSVFETVLVASEPMTARASHASVLVNDKIWIVGGAYFMGAKHEFVTVYNTVNATWESISTVNTPSSRYDHSLVQYKDKLFMFGGVTDKNTATNELWSLNMKSLEWQNETNASLSMSGDVPLAVAGHKAYVIGDEMLVFYGHNPFFGLLHRIQKYHLVNKVWEDVNDEGPAVLGRFGHSLVSYKKEDSEVILIYGGYMPAKDYRKKPFSSNSLIEYTCKSSKCSHRTLTSGIFPVFHHSASLINRMMIVIGGNGQNETGTHNALKCFSESVQQYDIDCDTWSTLDPDTLSPRYGHTSVATKDNIFIFGGFDGVMLDDVIKFTPGICETRKAQEDCNMSNNGVKCVFKGNKCKKYYADSSYALTFQSLVKNEDPSMEPQCPNQREVTPCTSRKSCISCTSFESCGWCEQTRECIVTENTCRDGDKPVEASKCTELSELRPCSFARDCFSCKLLHHCRWFPIEETKWKCKEAREILMEEGERVTSNFPSPSRSLALFTATGGNVTCPVPCAAYTACEDCFQGPCMWCPSVQKCIALDTYLINFPYGQCETWITRNTYTSNSHFCQLDPSNCSKQKTCFDCQNVGPSCGWCDDGSGTGLGRCLAGNLDGPLNSSLCSLDDNNHWYFVGCPACQCNGHSNCTTTTSSPEWFRNIPDQKCTRCDHNTTGEHCQYCADGFFGDPRNGGLCEACKCNDQAVTCNRDTGECYCATKGVIEKDCSQCDVNATYYGDPANGQPCYYQLMVDFIFTFKLDNNDPKDQHVTQIFFRTTPTKRNIDVMFTINCETVKPSKAYVTVYINSSTNGSTDKRLMVHQLCDEHSIRRTYSASDPEFEFGTNAKTTFLVKVYGFQTPIKIVISFSQSPPINWVLFFVIFAACFVILLVVAGLLWMIKLRLIHIQRVHDERIQAEMWSSRPLASACLELEQPLSPRATFMATPIAVEPCSNYRFGVFTVAVRLPTGGRQFTPHGTSGLAVASSVCFLTTPQLAVLQAPENNDAHRNRRKTTVRRYIPFIRSY